jgi:pyrroloquinoline quinone biosynthesis protein E
MTAARAAGLYTNLITSAVGITTETLRKLADAGLDHVQISIQDSERASADHIAGYEGAFARKRALAAEVVQLKIPLTVNAVMHRANIDRIGAMVDLALALGASRVEIAHVQYYGWALKNRAALMPSGEQVERAAAAVEELRRRHHGKIVIDAVVPDYYARLPKPCVGGWGRRSLNVTPSGKVLPCHAAESIPGLEFWSVREHSLADIWANSPAFNAFRGTDWMQEPCRSCARREIDFGGCRCQAFAMTGDARATDPVCHLAPRHREVAALAAVQSDTPYDYRRM